MFQLDRDLEKNKEKTGLANLMEESGSLAFENKAYSNGMGDSAYIRNSYQSLDS